jgi:glycosyltransferase involved in cell wall biosynthesis
VIAYVSQRFPAATETFTYDEVRALGQAGLDVRVFSFRPALAGPSWSTDDVELTVLPGRPGPYLRALGRWALRRPRRLLRAASWVVFGPFVRRPTWRERLAALAALPRGAVLAGIADAQLFHAQFANEAATAALVAGHLSGRPFSFRSHTAPNPQLLRTKLERAAVVLSISDYDARLLRATAPDARVEVARLGVAVPASEYERDPGLVVSVGSLIEKKGHHVLVDACAILARDGVRFRCEIVGEGWKHAELARRVAAASLEGRVVLRGALPRDETLALLGRANVAVLASVPSSSEGEDGIPVALMEAMALATPAVGTALSGIPELIRDGATGLVVPPGDAPALAAALRALLEDPALTRRLGEAGRETIRAEYDPKRVFARAAEILAAAARQEGFRGS